MSYCLVWKKEIIESDIKTMQEAQYLKGEYALAFQDAAIVIVRER